MTMQSIIDEYNACLAGEDLFLFWQKEIQLRQQIRKADAGENVHIESPAEFDFLQRALYFGPRREAFFSILYNNISTHSILKLVRESPLNLSREFLHFINGNVLERQPLRRDMDFLINLYSEELHSDYIELSQAMEKELCAYLLARTGNDNLRQILKTRLEQIATEQSYEHYGLIYSPREPGDEYPTFYGDKIELISAAAKSLRTVSSAALTPPLSEETIKMIAAAADLIFQAGLLSDCLALLNSLLTTPDIKNNLPSMDRDLDFQPINRVLAKALPMYSILIKPDHAHIYTLDLYRNRFPGFGPDPIALLYLDIYSIVMTGLQGHRQYARYELAQQAIKVLQRRPDDLLARALLGRDKKSAGETISALEKAIEQKMAGQPHEAYVTMEVLRFGHQKGWISLNRPSAANLLRNYMELFHWLPGSSFMNEKLVKQLAPLSDDDTARKAQNIIAGLREFSFQNTGPAEDEQKNFQPNQPDTIRKHLSLSKYMGVF